MGALTSFATKSTWMIKAHKEELGMALVKKTVRIEWMCTHCGQKVTRAESTGRPAPGTCPRKPGKGPHTWVKNRKI